MDWLKKVAQTLRYQIATREPFEPAAPASIQISTIWWAKGVTADHVYVLGLCKEAIPGNRRDEYPGTENEHFEEERRLFYVSLTREKCTLVLSRPNKIRTNEAAQIGVRVSKSRLIYSSLEVSPFFLDILEFLPRGVSGDTWNELVERT